jgi:hypothetical protein
MPAMIGAVQTHGDLINWHPHIHAVCAEGVFCRDGRFEPVEHINRERAVEIFRDKVFDFLFDAGLLNLDDIESMMSWRHSGFSIDTSVRIEADDRAGMQRLIEYISRCPFSLARMVKLTDDGKVMYRAGHADCIRFPELGREMDLRPGMRRNYQVFDPLDFLASVTQHIPNKGEHLLRYYGWYSNKSRGMRTAETGDAQHADQPEQLSAYELKRRLTWAALIKCVYEVNPLECPRCGTEMRIAGFIERENSGLIRSLLKQAGLWKDFAPRAPPKVSDDPPAEDIAFVAEAGEYVLDAEYFNSIC